VGALNFQKIYFLFVIGFTSSQCSIPSINENLLKVDLYLQLLKNLQNANGGSTTSSGEAATGRSISGAVTGLRSIGFTLRNSDGKQVVLAPGQTDFLISNAEKNAYSISIHRQPLGQRCTLTNQSGNSQNDVSDITVSCNGIGEAGIGIWDTGVTQCYTNSNLSAGTCPQAGFLEQDGDVSPVMARSMTVRANGNIKDNITGLIWNPCVVGLSGAGCATGVASTSNYTTALTRCVAPWRVPTIKELMSIIDYSNTTYGLVPSFPNHPVGFHLWSSTEISASMALTVNITTGLVEFTMKSNTALAYVQCVNDSEIIATTPNFTDIGNGIIRDEVSGLEWEKCIEGLSGTNCNIGVNNSHVWQGHLTYCSNLSLGGFTDWRMPNILELTSIVDFTRWNQTTTLDPIFVGSPFGTYKSSTTFGSANTQHWYNSVGNFPFLPASTSSLNNKAQAEFTRCVRGPVASP
jgi:hypothetical protein